MLPITWKTVTLKWPRRPDRTQDYPRQWRTWQWIPIIRATHSLCFCLSIKNNKKVNNRFNTVRRLLSLHEEGGRETFLRAKWYHPTYPFKTGDIPLGCLQSRGVYRIPLPNPIFSSGSKVFLTHDVIRCRLMNIKNGNVWKPLRSWRCRPIARNLIVRHPGLMDSPQGLVQ